MNGAHSSPVSPQLSKVLNWAPGTVRRDKGKQKASTICKDCEEPALPEAPGFEQLLSCSSCLEFVFLPAFPSSYAHALTRRSVHHHCQGYEDELFEACLGRSDWHCASCATCSLCHQRRPDAQEQSQTVLCDACDRTYHLNCLNPPLESVDPDSMFLATAWQSF
jgi:hypothetical protein